MFEEEFMPFDEPVEGDPTPSTQQLIFTLDTNPDYTYPMGCLYGLSDDEYEAMINKTAQQIAPGSVVTSWSKLNEGDPIPQSQEDQYLEARKVVFDQYEKPFNGVSGGIVVLAQMVYSAALLEVPQDSDKITTLATNYQTALSDMNAAYAAVDAQFGL